MCCFWHPVSAKRTIAFSTSLATATIISVCIDLTNHIIIYLVLSTILVTHHFHHYFIQLPNVILLEVDTHHLIQDNFCLIHMEMLVQVEIFQHAVSFVLRQNIRIREVSVSFWICLE